ncbi:hypothetical protein F4810DRAFT_715014 [Camillea tinctor]|nr:hypothetical protein F4810DRAFT_715014 [Camillea tinctor]
MSRTSRGEENATNRTESTQQVSGRLYRMQVQENKSDSLFPICSTPAVLRGLLTQGILISKCDEKQPCTYCVKRHLPCSLQPEPKKARTAARSLTIRPPDTPSSFCCTDFGLFRHFTKALAMAHADDGPSVMVWSETVPDLAIRHPFLMHELLAALTAAQARRRAPIARALPLFRAALAAESNAHQDALPLFACACLIVPYHFAAALLRNADTARPPEWLVLIAGCAAVTLRHRTAILDSPLRLLLGELRSPALEDLPGMSPVADGLLVALKARLPAALRFPACMGARCKEDSAAGEPPALVVVGFWCVLLYRVEDRWWLRGRVRPLLVQIRELLPPEHHGLIAGPLEQLGVPILV